MFIWELPINICIVCNHIEFFIFFVISQILDCMQFFFFLLYFLYNMLDYLKMPLGRGSVREMPTRQHFLWCTVLSMPAPAVMLAVSALMLA